MREWKSITESGKYVPVPCGLCFSSKRKREIDAVGLFMPFSWIRSPITCSSMHLNITSPKKDKYPNFYLIWQGNTESGCGPVLGGSTISSKHEEELYDVGLLIELRLGPTATDLWIWELAFCLTGMDWWTVSQGFLIWSWEANLGELGTTGADKPYPWQLWPYSKLLMWLS